MGLLSAALSDYLNNHDLTQAEFAQACGISAPTVSDYLNGKIEITRSNLPIILRGVADQSAQVRMLVAYLNDQVPLELRSEISIVSGGGVQEAQAPYYGSGMTGLRKSTREAMAALLERLRDDADLCSLVEGMIKYLSAEDVRTFRRANRTLAHERPRK